MSVCAIALFATRGLGASAFWIFGLILCAFVGPAQSASRTFLSRIIPPGREGEVFGLYATTGRAAIWMSPALYALAIAISPATGTAARTSWGILGILVVILAGLAVLLPVKPGQTLQPPVLEDTAAALPASDSLTGGADGGAVRTLDGMEAGVHLPQVEFAGEGLSLRRLADTVDAARANGFAAVSVNDHFLFGAPWLDGLTALAAVAERSGPMTLATTVSLAALRGPVPLAKAVATLDILSGGRVVAGVRPLVQKRL